LTVDKPGHSIVACACVCVQFLLLYLELPRACHIQL